MPVLAESARRLFQGQMGAGTLRFPEAIDWNFLIIRKEHLTSAEMNQLRVNLVAINSYDEEKQFSMYNEDDDFFYLPRYYFKDRFFK